MCSQIDIKSINSLLRIPPCHLKWRWGSVLLSHFSILKLILFMMMREHLDLSWPQTWYRHQILVSHWVCVPFESKGRKIGWLGIHHHSFNPPTDLSLAKILYRNYFTLEENWATISSPWLCVCCITFLSLFLFFSKSHCHHHHRPMSWYEPSRAAAVGYYSSSPPSTSLIAANNNNHPIIVSPRPERDQMLRPTLPESLEAIQKAEYMPSQRHRWNTNEEIAAILIAFDKHEEWLSKEVKIRYVLTLPYAPPCDPSSSA